MRISISISGVSAVIKAFDEQQKKRDRALQDAVNLTAQLIRTDAIRSMKQSPATGITYVRKSGKGKPIRHTASSSPNPPRIDQGDLIKSIKALVGKLEARVGTNQRYGPHLEFGTRKMEPRPWLFPAFERQRRNFVNRLREAMR